MNRVQNRLCGWCVIAVGFMFAVSADASAGEITWQKDLNKAAKESIRSKKPMLVKFTADWCGYCHKMADETFADQRVVKHVNDCYIAVTIDVDARAEFAESLGIEGLPTTLIISHKLKVVKKLTGYQSADEIDKQLHALCKTSHKPTTPELVQSVAKRTE